MVDYEKLKVTELKEELKSRGIPLTGLKLKQQMIDRLIELDAENAEQEHEDETDEPNEDAEIEPHKPVSPKKPNEEPDTQPEQPIQTVEAEDEDLNSLPPALKEEESRTEDEKPPEPVEAATASEAAEIEKNDPFIPQQSEEASQASQDVPMGDGPEDEYRNNISEKVDESEDHARPAAVQKDDTEQMSSQVEGPTDIQPTEDSELLIAPISNRLDSSEQSTSDPSIDQRKRKRTSITPDQTSEEAAEKKIKSNDGQAIATRKESTALESIKQATDEAQAIRDPDGLGHDEPPEPMETDITTAPVEMGRSRSRDEEHGLVSPEPRQKGSHSSYPSEPDPVEEREVAPAIHPATCSLYIRNFKRPLHIPSLRAHVSSIAHLSPADGENPIKVFYLDNIRTHAFISFHSVASASRVRSAMHETRFPDEQMRQPLWVDFIPDEKVEAWIEQESGGGFGGGRGSSQKFEVVYNDGVDGVEAVLQNMSDNFQSVPHRPVRPQQSQSHVDPTTAVPVASGIHPERAALIPREGRNSRPRPSNSQQGPPPPEADPGRGFKALDELFSSTAVKPKLYYKPVPPSVVDARLDLIQDLRVGHNDMGRSGDEGMKRYSFETYKGRDEWVDKGPEFGFGRKGQERLSGFNRGGGRGRGGFRGGRRIGGDSWRGNARPPA